MKKIYPFSIPFFLVIGLLFIVLDNSIAQLNITCMEANLIDLNNNACVTQNTINTEFDTNNSMSCTVDPVGTLWYKFSPTTTTIFRFKTNASFNDNISLYIGNSCANLTEVDCLDRDEFGFTGEEIFAHINSTDTCFIRIAGSQKDFGKCVGDICLEITPDGGIPNAPANDLCGNAISISANQTCVSGTNRHASFDGNTPLGFDLARADVWFSFTPSESIEHTIQSKAEFSEIITLYTGTCSSMTEIISTDEGQELQTPILIAGQNYLIQISGVFSTVEGGFCFSIQNCPDNLTLLNGTDDYINNENLHREVANIISADNVIDNGSNIIFDAGNFIELNAGFEVKTGAELEAFIEGCGDGNQN